MVTDYTKVRRSDRAVEDEEWIEALLDRAPVGYLATVHEGQPFINSNLFVYDPSQQAIYLHTARKGRTRNNVEQDDRASFTVSEMGRLLPADEALEFSVEYGSVVVFGRVELVLEEAEATAALQQLLDKYAPHLEPGQDYRPPVPEELKRTSVYRLDIDEWSGKKKEVGHFPGAYYYGRRPAPTSTLAAGNGAATWPPPLEVHKGQYTVSTDRSRLDLDTIHRFLSQESYWAKGVPRAKVARSMQHALCFGVYQGEQQVGFARVTTDFTLFAYIGDVFILREHRGQGLGKWLIATILAHPELQGLRQWALDTEDAHGLYERFGFHNPPVARDHLKYRPGEAAPPGNSDGP